MQFSTFGQKFTRQSGILQLMDDLGQALASDKPVNMLGGGNPAMIPAVNEVYQATLEQLVADGTALNSVANYSTPQGDKAFVDSLVDFFNRHYDWGLTADNIALTNGSQNAFFICLICFQAILVARIKKSFCHLHLSTSAMQTLMWTARILWR